MLVGVDFFKRYSFSYAEKLFSFSHRRHLKIMMLMWAIDRGFIFPTLLLFTWKICDILDFSKWFAIFSSFSFEVYIQ